MWLSGLKNVKQNNRRENKNKNKKAKRKSMSNGHTCQHSANGFHVAIIASQPRMNSVLRRTEYE